MMLAIETDTIQLTREIVGMVTSGGGFSTVGKGLAAIFILFHIGSCGIALFQEQKFRLKMLYPFIVFFIVCNFQMVTTPTVATLQSVTSTLCSSLNSQKLDALAELGRDADSGNSSTSILEAMANRRQAELVDAYGKRQAETLEQNVEAQMKDENTVSENGESVDKNWVERKISSITGSIAGEIMKAWEKMKANFVDALVPWHGDVLKVTALGIIAVVLQFVMDVMTLAMSAFGAMLTGLLVAFGPITFALACFPEKLNVILHWFLRLLQYSLWAPIISLIGTFVTKTYSMLLDSSSAGNSAVGAIAALVAAIVCLTQVPTIAGMIIEGVSGNASLSMGLSTVGSYMAAPMRFINSLVAGGEDQRDSRQEELLKQIVVNTGGGGASGGNGGSDGQAPSGLNTN